MMGEGKVTEPAFERWYYETEFDGLTIEEIARVAWWAGREYQGEWDSDLIESLDLVAERLPQQKGGKR